MFIYLIGFMGCGKSTFGKRLARKLTFPFYDLDDEIIKSEKTSINSIFEIYGENVFREKEKEILIKITSSNSGAVISTGGGTSCYFDNMKFMNQSGTTIFLNLDYKILYKRLLLNYKSRPLLKDYKPEELKSRISQLYKSREKYYKQAKIHLSTFPFKVNNVIEKLNSINSPSCTSTLPEK